jgi:hypothetical protein
LIGIPSSLPQDWQDQHQKGDDEAHYDVSIFYGFLAFGIDETEW